MDFAMPETPASPASLKHVAVLKELGLLLAGEENIDAGPGEEAGNHVFSDHNPLWAYARPVLAAPWAGGSGGRPKIFDFLPPKTTVAEAAAHTKLLVFIGAVDTPALSAALQDKDSIKLVFDPDLHRLERFINRSGARSFLNKNIFFFGGDPDSFSPALEGQLPQSLSGQGFPVFFVLEGLTRTRPETVKRVIDRMELFYFRRGVYPLESQDNVRTLPFRPMKRTVMYDRARHLYENLAACLTYGSIAELKGKLRGETAVLIGAGPSLDEQLDRLRRFRENTVLIAVNNALPTLVKNGLEPDFAVINDTSVDAGRCVERLPKLKKTLLAAHCLSSIGGDVFSRVCFFGSDHERLFPPRPSLKLHGSVITTAFSLAEHLGCASAFLVGAELSSPHPFSLSYAKDSVHGASDLNDALDRLTNAHPQLLPQTAADGRRVFTTLNFYDAAQWFIDRIAHSKVKVANTSPASIVFGRGISLDPDPEPAPSPGLRKRISEVIAASPQPPQTSPERVRTFILEAVEAWRTRKKIAKAALENLDRDPEHLDQAIRWLQIFDNDNTSNMLARRHDFNNPLFHKTFFQAKDHADKIEGLRYYYTRLQGMCETLLAILVEQLERVNAMVGSEGG